MSDGRFRITADETEVSVPLADLIPTAFGRRVQGMGPVEPSQINGLGFMLSDKQPGRFQMRVEWVKVLRSGESARLNGTGCPVPGRQHSLTRHGPGFGEDIRVLRPRFCRGSDMAIARRCGFWFVSSFCPRMWA
ncbi:MAG: CIA30 family protein [Planctomycetia bacterium]